MAEMFPLPCISFIAMIDTTSTLLGTATSAALRDAGKKVGACDAPLEELQGPAEEVKPGIFIQKRCPFADAIKLYADQGRKIPTAVKDLAAFANAHGGAWVSAFCGVHQNLRVSKNPNTVQIACRGGDGTINYAPNDYITEDDAKNMVAAGAVCVYAVPA